MSFPVKLSIHHEVLDEDRGVVFVERNSSLGEPLVKSLSWRGGEADIYERYTITSITASLDRILDVRVVIGVQNDIDRVLVLLLDLGEEDLMFTNGICLTDSISPSFICLSDEGFFLVGDRFTINSFLIPSTISTPTKNSLEHIESSELN